MAILLPRFPPRMPPPPPPPPPPEVPTPTADDIEQQLQQQTRMKGIGRVLRRLGLMRLEDTEDVGLSNLKVKMGEAPQDVLGGLRRIGRNPDSETFLKSLKPDIDDGGLNAIFGTPPPVSAVSAKVTAPRPFPGIKPLTPPEPPVEPPPSQPPIGFPPIEPPQLPPEDGESGELWDKIGGFLSGNIEKPFQFGVRRAFEGTRDFFLRTVPNLIFPEEPVTTEEERNQAKAEWDKNVASGMSKQDASIIFNKKVRGATKPAAMAERINEQNRVSRDKFRQTYIQAQEQDEVFWNKHPDLLKSEYEDGKTHFDDTGWYIYTISKYAPMTIAALTAAVGTTVVTRNPVAGMAAAAAVFTPISIQDVADDLIAAGVPEQQAALVATPVGLLISGLESVGEIPILKATSPVLMAVLKREITREVGKLTMRQLAKKGITTFTQAEIAETATEVLQQAIQNATVRVFDQTRSITEGLGQTAAQTGVATLPFAGFGGGASIISPSEARAIAEELSNKARVSLQDIAQTGERLVSETGATVPGRPQPVEPEGVTPVTPEVTKLTTDELQNITDIIDHNVFKDNVAQSIQKDGQKLLDAIRNGDTNTLDSLMRKYQEEATRGISGGAGPKPSKPGRVGSSDIWNAANKALGKMRAKFEVAIPKAEPVKPEAVIGRETVAYGPDPTKSYQMRYRLVELDDLIPSHTDAFAPNPKYPKELQPRIRERGAARLAVTKMAKGLVPEVLIKDDNTLDRGPMIIGNDNVVESGNGRVMALRQAQQSYPERWQAYQMALQEALAQFGFEARQLAGMRNPVLVRERISDVDRVEFASEANQPAVAVFSPLENALQDARRIRFDTLSIPEETQGLDVTLRMASNRPFVTSFLETLPANERASLLDNAGDLNLLGVQRIKAAMFAATYRGESGRRLTQIFFESREPIIRNIEEGMLASLPKVARAEDLVRAGNRGADLSIGEDLAKSLDMLAVLRQRKLSVAQYLAQRQMFERELSPFQERLLQHAETIARSPRKVREFLGDYADAVVASPHPQQATMIAGRRLSKEDLFNATVKREEEGPLFATEEAIAIPPTPEGKPKLVEKALRIPKAEPEIPVKAPVSLEIPVKAIEPSLEAPSPQKPFTQEVYEALPVEESQKLRQTQPLAIPKAEPVLPTKAEIPPVKPAGEIPITEVKTGEPFTAKLYRGETSELVNEDRGIFMTPDKETANLYAGKTPGARVTFKTETFSNPLVFGSKKDTGKFLGYKEKPRDINRGIYAEQTIETQVRNERLALGEEQFDRELAWKARKEGYDAIVYTEGEEGKGAVVDLRQVKPPVTPKREVPAITEAVKPDISEEVGSIIRQFPRSISDVVSKVESVSSFENVGYKESTETLFLLLDDKETLVSQIAHEMGHIHIGSSILRRERFTDFLEDKAKRKISYANIGELYAAATEEIFTGKPRELSLAKHRPGFKELEEARKILGFAKDFIREEGIIPQAQPVPPAPAVARPEPVASRVPPAKAPEEVARLAEQLKAKLAAEPPPAKPTVPKTPVQRREEIKTLLAEPAKNLPKGTTKIALRKELAEINKALIPQEKKLRQQIMAVARSKALPEKQYRDIFKNTGGSRHLSDISLPDLQKVLAVVEKTRPKKIGGRTVVTEKTEKAIQSLKNALINQGKLTNDVYKDIMKYLRLKTDRFNNPQSFISEPQAKEFIRQMNYEVEVGLIEKDNKIATALENNPKLKYAIGKIRASLNVALERAKAKLVGVSPFWDMHLYLEKLQERTGERFADVWEEAIRIMYRNEALLAEMDNKLFEEAGEDFAKIASSDTALQRINDYIASKRRFEDSAVEEPADMTDAEKRIAEHIEQELFGLQDKVRQTRFYTSYRENKGDVDAIARDIPNAPKADIRQAADIYETQGRDALNEYLDTKSWGVIRSGYEPHNAIDYRLRIAPSKEAAVGKSHLRSREETVARQDRNILDRRRSYLRQAMNWDLEAYLRKLDQMMVDVAPGLENPAQVKDILEQAMRELKGFHPTDVMTKTIQRASSYAFSTLALSPTMTLRNALQNLFLHPHREAFVHLFDTRLDQTGKKYFGTFINAQSSIVMDLLMQEGMGTTRLEQLVRRLTYYGWAETKINRAPGFLASYGKALRALNRYNTDGNLSRFIKSSGIEELTPLEQKQVLGMMAQETVDFGAEGLEAVPGGQAAILEIARRIVQQTHFNYKRAERAPIEMGAQGRTWGSLMTFPRNVGQRIYQDALRVKRGNPRQRELAVRRLIAIFVFAYVSDWLYRKVAGKDQSEYNPLTIIASWGLGGLAAGAGEVIGDVIRNSVEAVTGDESALNRLIIAIPRAGDMFVPFYKSTMDFLETLTDTIYLDRKLLREVRQILDENYKLKPDYYERERSWVQKFQHAIFGGGNKEAIIEIPGRIGDIPEPLEAAEKAIPEALANLGGKDQFGLDKALREATADKASPAKIAEIKAKDWTYDITSLRRDISDAIRTLSDKNIAKLTPIAIAYAEFFKQKDAYGDLSDKEQEAYLKDNPDFVTNRLFWGELTSIPGLKTAEALAAKAEKHGIKLDMIPAFQKTDKGKERIPSDKKLWKPYFDYTELPANSYLNFTRKQVDAGELPEKYRKDWERFQKLTNDRAKTAFKKARNKKGGAAYGGWRDDFRRENLDFDKWAIDLSNMGQAGEGLKPLTKAGTRATANIRAQTARPLFGGFRPVSGRRRPAKPAFTFPKARMTASIGAP